MKTMSKKAAGKAIILSMAAVLFLSSVANAQDWNGRRYSSEDPGACHEYIVNTITSTSDFKKEDAATRQSIMTVLSMTEMNIGFVFKSKKRVDMTVMMRLNQKVAKAAKLDDETKAQFQSLLNELSADMKETLVYSVDGDTLTFIDDDKEKITFTIKDDGKKLASGEFFNKMIFVRKK